MASSYERLIRAVNILNGPGSIQERLASAYRTELQYVGPEGLDEMTMSTLERINDELTKVDAAGDKDAIDMSTGMMTDDEAQNLIDEVRSIYQYLDRHRGRGRTHATH
jgi:hypothetical protein